MLLHHLHLIILARSIPALTKGATYTVADFQTCLPASENLRAWSNATCCVAITDVATTSQDCAPTIADWQTCILQSTVCSTVNATCCVARADNATGKTTCRPGGQGPTLRTHRSIGVTVVRIFITEVDAGLKNTSATYTPDLEPSTLGVFNDTILTTVDEFMYRAQSLGVKLGAVRRAARHNEALGYSAGGDPNWVCARAMTVKQLVRPGILVFTGGGTDVGTLVRDQYLSCPSIDVISVHSYDAGKWVNASNYCSLMDKVAAAGKRAVIEELGARGSDRASSLRLQMARGPELGRPLMPWQVVKPRSQGDYEFWVDEGSVRDGRLVGSAGFRGLKWRWVRVGMGRVQRRQVRGDACELGS
ncbi:glycoside hydrolase family 5 protein [Gonapodya prolifera JEL478]|uniref:Glycoside hydrolase family 5 protein n=1 Tax=Gonapodya prolifera (strain JEL478) TaxID=1344416 RepID=A0A139ACG4_GONPJ|nr:glycoside hydrolase family 5 protein [Gonapodya prolifera JEL478]|eukprot:KXS14438.1 glycoside hydrolase family 5 protein [Gonapodya prolifera JEL478]